MRKARFYLSTAAASATVSNRFLTIWPYTLAQECPYPNDWSNPANFSDTPGDPGGATMCGIIQSEYNVYLQANRLPLQSVRLITKPQGETIYYNNYFLPHCPVLPVGLDLGFFDESVNTGATEAVRVLQVALNISDDGIWGPQTLGAVEGLNTTELIQAAVEAFTARRLEVYKSLPDFAEFGTDWTRRTEQIGAASLTMAQNSIS